MKNEIKQIKELFTISNFIFLIWLCIILAIVIIISKGENLKRSNSPIKFDLSEEVIEVCIKGHLHYQKDCGQCRCIVPASTDDGKPIKCYNDIGEK